jgi:hypothetical protein
MTADALSAGPAGFSTPPAAFYCVSSRPYFPGAVAVLNSLRMVGHREPLFVLDCGLDPVQRKLLTPHTTLVAAPSGVEPTLFKARAPLAHPAEVMVLLDADMIVTRPLSDLIEKAAEGSIVAFETGRDRFFAEWGPLLGLGPIRRQRYLSSGFLCMARGVGTEVLRLVTDLQAHIDPDLLWWGSGRPSEPFCFGDQDVLNAVLSSRIAPDRIVALQNRLLSELPFEGLRVIDAARLRCAYADGLEPYLVHHILYKPWLDAPPHTPAVRLRRPLTARPTPRAASPSHRPVGGGHPGSDQRAGARPVVCPQPPAAAACGPLGRREGKEAGRAAADGAELVGDMSRPSEPFVSVVVSARNAEPSIAPGVSPRFPGI